LTVSFDADARLFRLGVEAQRHGEHEGKGSQKGDKSIAFLAVTTRTRVGDGF
jgi:hypothetical protein